MIEFDVKSKILNVGERKGQTVYYAQPKMQQRMPVEEVKRRIVRETSLSEGDVNNAMVSLRNVVCDGLRLGMSIDLGDLGTFRIVVPSKMMDSEEEVTAEKALKTPKIVFTPKQVMRDAAKAVEVMIDKGDKESTEEGTEDEGEQGIPNP